MAHRLARIRELLTRHNLAGYVLPRTDEHQSEYLAPQDERVKFISGFSGSSALTFVSHCEALLWTDSRYFLQAQKELDQGWQLKKMLPGAPKWFQDISSSYQKQKIGFDPTLITAKNGEERIAKFSQKEIEFVPLKGNLVDRIWEDRPKGHHPDIFMHGQWAGRSIGEKLAWVRQKINEKKGRAAIFNDLSEIAWLLNLRSGEIPHNPFFKSTLVVTVQGGRLYLPAVHPSLCSAELLKYLGAEGIVVTASEPEFEEQSLIVKDSLNYFIYERLKGKNWIEWEGIGLFRAVRHQKQIQGFRRCHLADGIAMAKFWAWRASQQTVSEYESAQKIDSLRSAMPLNRGTSFDTISAGGPNGAIIHYRPEPNSSLIVTKDMVHLVDSGGQYLDGTTDVTRAFHFGSPTPEEKQAFTRVLKGNLDIERLRWPKDTLTGAEIDVLARRHLWSRGWDYLHGTGHGVGHFAGVHESPVGISRVNRTKLRGGMIVTNEPGYYCQGRFGIRIENMLLVREEQGFNWFQNLTLCPYDRNLIEMSLLDGQTIKFIDQYHHNIWNKLSKQLQGDISTLQWLQKATLPLQ